MYPQERELVDRLTNRPFALLSVNTDPERETLLESIRTGEITWRCWWDGGQNGPITSRWNVLSFPSIFVIDAGGVIRELGTRGTDLDQTVEGSSKRHCQRTTRDERRRDRQHQWLDLTGA
jgi:hypothetical protein